MFDRLFNGGKFISRGKGIHPSRIIDSDELIFVVRGELAVYEEDDSFHLNPGEWLFLQRGKRHGGSAVYPNNLVFFWFHFLRSERFYDLLAKYGKAANPAEISEYMQNLLNEQSRIEPDMSIQHLLFELILRELSRSTAKDISSGCNPTPLAKAASQYLNLHYMENISLASTAAVLQCNVEYLGKIFQKCYGESFVSALNKRRIEKAAEQLAGGTLSIKSVAGNCGFNDPAYFRRKFIFYYNQTPGEFRKKHSTGHLNTT